MQPGGPVAGRISQCHLSLITRMSSTVVGFNAYLFSFVLYCCCLGGAAPVHSGDVALVGASLLSWHMKPLGMGENPVPSLYGASIHFGCCAGLCSLCPNLPSLCRLFLTLGFPFLLERCHGCLASLDQMLGMFQSTSE